MIDYNAVKEEIVQVLSDRIEFNESQKDGRTNSSLDEDTIADILLEHFGDDFTEAPPRKWWDCQIYGIPCNIKSTTGGTDNAGNYLMLRHCLNSEEVTETLLQKSANKGRDVFEGLIPVINKYKNDTLESTDTNYLFIVAMKGTGKVFVRGLKEINEVKSNPSNLPFQINWSKEMQLPEAKRSMKELVEVLLIEPLSAVERSFEVRVHNELGMLWTK